jgi:RHS repeat-associated protein
MMPAAKHGDPQMGVDIHLCIVPPSPSPVPLPTPHMSVVFDPFDYLPILGATVTVCGMKRAVAGTSGKAVHIPPGFPFAPKLPDTSDEIFMGSATVVADSNPFSFLGVPVLSCQVAGMPSPPRPKQQEKKLMLLPTTVNVAIPTNVFIGGPPTISLMGMAFKLGFAGLGRLAKTRFAKALGKRFRDWRKAKFGHLTPSFLKCKILRAEPVNIVTGAVSVEQEDFTLPGLLPMRWTRRYTSDNARRGACGMGWECPADSRLEHDVESGIVLFHHPEGGHAIFAALPSAQGDDAAVLELMDGALLSDHGNEYRVRTKEDLVYRFPKGPGGEAGAALHEYPLWQIHDRCGNTLTWERERVSGRPLALVEAMGRRIELEQGPDGLVRSVALHVPQSGFRHTYAQYGQDAAGDLVEVRDALGQSCRFAYDRHHMVRHTDRNGLSFHYEYDQSGEQRRVVRAWGDGGLYAYRFAYVDALNQRRITDSLGHVSLVTLDERGLPISEVDALGGTTSFEYDEAGRTTAVVDQDGHRTEYAFDAQGNLVSLTRPDGVTIANTFSEDGKLEATTDPNGGVWRQRWDERGLLAERLSPLGHTFRYQHGPRGEITAATDASGARTAFAYDGVGNLAAITDALGGRCEFRCDPLGNIISKHEPVDRNTLYRYDAKGRLLALQRPSGASVRYAYDAEDNLVSLRDENGAETRFVYAGLNQLARRIQPDGHAVEYLYDTEERLAAIRNQRGEIYRFRRDPLGRVVEEVDFWGTRRSYVHSASGRLLAATDPLGQRIEHAYDPLGQLVKSTACAPDGAAPSVETFAYDAGGNLLAAANDQVEIRRVYDADGRLVREEQRHAAGQVFTVDNAYDGRGQRIARVARHRAEGSTTVEYALDPLGDGTVLRVNGTERLRTRHDHAGQVIEEQFGGGLGRSCSYDADGLPTEISSTRDGATLFATRYQHDAVGNLVSRSDSAFGADLYGYDALGRVVTHTDPEGRLRQFFHDPAGDRLALRDGDADQPGVCRQGRHDEALYQFDAAGSLTHKSDRRSRLELVWDARQRLVASRRVTDQGARETRYGYDPFGRRLFKETEGRRTWFGWDEEALAAEIAADGSAKEFVYRARSLEPLLIIETRDGAEARIHACFSDPNGCPVRLVDAKGATQWAASYRVWGEIATQHAAHCDNPLRLLGQYHDSETGLHYNRYRYFDPQAGCFVSRDPLSLRAGTDLHAFAPNPFGWIDPLGLTCKPGYQYRARTKGTPDPGLAGFVGDLKARGVTVVGENLEIVESATGRVVGEVDVLTTHAAIQYKNGASSGAAVMRQIEKKTEPYVDTPVAAFVRGANGTEKGAQRTVRDAGRKHLVTNDMDTLADAIR